MVSKKKILFGMLILLVPFLFLPTQSPIEEEYEWYQDQGYSAFKLDYVDLLDSLPGPVTVNEIPTSKLTLREKAAWGEINMGGQCIVAWCPDQKAIMVVADFDPDTEVATIYYWKP
jgi:hypothetical protein